MSMACANEVAQPNTNTKIYDHSNNWKVGVEGFILNANLRPPNSLNASYYRGKEIVP